MPCGLRATRAVYSIRDACGSTRVHSPPKRHLNDALSRFDIIVNPFSERRETHRRIDRERKRKTEKGWREEEGKRETGTQLMAMGRTRTCKAAWVVKGRARRRRAGGCVFRRNMGLFPFATRFARASQLAFVQRVRRDQQFRCPLFAVPPKFLPPSFSFSRPLFLSLDRSLHLSFDLLFSSNRVCHHRSAVSLARGLTRRRARCTK